MGGALRKLGNTLFGDNSPMDPGANIRNMARPDDPTYLGLTDKDGNLDPRFKLSSGEQYSELAKNQLAQSQAEARDNNAIAGTGSAIAARNSLASRGGLSGGAAALLQRNQMENTMKGDQAVTQAGIKGSNDIGMKQFDIGREAEKANIGSLISNQRGQNEFNQSRYATQMAEYGASQTADAMARAAPKPKGGVVGGLTQGVAGITGKRG
jgi:hypothetical protein